MREQGEFVLADGILGRAVEGAVTRRRRARRAQRYLQIGWDDTAAAAVRLNTDHTTRLWLVLQLQTALERPEDGWIKPRRQLLDQIELPHRIRDILIRLERAGLVEVQRQPNKRALVKLVTSEAAHDKSRKMPTMHITATTAPAPRRSDHDQGPR